MYATDNGLLTSLPVAELCRRCAEETARFHQGAPSDDGPCFELFRRAIVERDECCWRELVSLYDAQVRAWCRRAARCLDDPDELAALTWEKFWQHCTAEKLRAAGSTAQLLCYLKLCARSVAVDAARVRAAWLSLDQAVVDWPDSAPSPADVCGEGAARTALWQMVDTHVHDEREQVVVHLLYELGWKSAEIQLSRPDLFPSVQEVYRVTRNVLDRLRRSQALRAWYAQERC